MVHKTTAFYLNLFKNFMQSWIFSIITAVFSVINPSEISLICWFAAQETFLIILIIKLWKLRNIFVEITAFIWNCVFIFTFDQSNAFSLNTNIISKKKKITLTSNFLTVMYFCNSYVLYSLLFLRCPCFCKLLEKIGLDSMLKSFDKSL